MRPAAALLLLFWAAVFRVLLFLQDEGILLADAGLIRFRDPAKRRSAGRRQLVATVDGVLVGNPQGDDATVDAESSLVQEGVQEGDEHNDHNEPNEQQEHEQQHGEQLEHQEQHPAEESTTEESIVDDSELLSEFGATSVLESGEEEVIRAVPRPDEDLALPVRVDPGRSTSRSGSSGSGLVEGEGAGEWRGHDHHVAGAHAAHAASAPHASASDPSSFLSHTLAQKERADAAAICLTAGSFAQGSMTYSADGTYRAPELIMYGERKQPGPFCMTTAGASVLRQALGGVNPLVAPTAAPQNGMWGGAVVNHAVVEILAVPEGRGGVNRAVRAGQNERETSSHVLSFIASCTKSVISSVPGPSSHV